MTQKLIDISNINIPKELPKIPFYKEPTMYEIACSLFEACNLKCKFCFEGHRNNKIDLEYIRNIPKNVFNSIKENLDKYKTIKFIQIRLWGGELFFDGLPDSLFQEYKNLTDEFKRIIQKEYNIEIRFSWLTNGVFTKWERVVDLLKYCNGTIGFSYDPSGRFSNKQQENLMIENVNRFHNLKLFNCLSITLTKETINEYINGKSRLLTDLNIGEIFDINFYTANPNWEKLIPSDDDLFNFFKWGIDNKLYSINVISNLIKTCINKIPYTSYHYCDCKTCVQYTNGQTTIDCVKRASVLDRKMFYGEFEKYVTEENVSEIKLAIGMKKRGCLNCEYYNSCQMPCWVSMIFEGFKATNCCYKQAYEYIKSNLEIIKDFKEWYQKTSLYQ